MRRIGSAEVAGPIPAISLKTKAFRGIISLKSLFSCPTKRTNESLTFFTFFKTKKSYLLEKSYYFHTITKQTQNYNTTLFIKDSLHLVLDYVN